MFTGIVQAMGRIERVERKSRGLRLHIASCFPEEPFVPGESVAVDGVCLTVAEKTSGGFAADVSDETASRSTLEACRPGAAVNLERALRLSDRLGGHIVTGHVDGVGNLAARQPAGNSTILSFTAPGALLELIAEKGSIAVDGVSLTVAGLLPAGFAVALVPHTANSTTLGARLPGSRVNLEVDVLARYVRRILAGERAAATQRPGLDELLKECLR